MNYPSPIDLHMHSTVSDGTDTPPEILAHAKAAGLALFALTDHDAIEGAQQIAGLLQPGDPQFLCGAEFSCKDEEGKYHILGYGYDPEAPSILQVVRTGREYRFRKLKGRLDFLESEFGFRFPPEEIDRLFGMTNPGKPHIGNLMVKYGYAKTKEQAIKEFIDRRHFRSEYVRPREAIVAILAAGGIPVLAHPSYGSGDQLIIGKRMDERLRRLIGYGLQGVEAFYSGFTKDLQDEVLGFAEKYDLYVTAGSDYHGKNKLVVLGDNNLEGYGEYPAGLRRFLNEVRYAG